MGRNLEFVFGERNVIRLISKPSTVRAAKCTAQEGGGGGNTYEMLNLRMDTRKSAVQSTGNTYSAIWCLSLRMPGRTLIISGKEGVSLAAQSRGWREVLTQNILNAWSERWEREIHL